MNIPEQAKLALRNEYADWKHENSLSVLEQYEKLSSLLGEDKMPSLERFSQIFFSELIMIQKGRMIQDKLKAKLEELKNKKQITIAE